MMPLLFLMQFSSYRSVSPDSGELLRFQISAVEQEKSWGKKEFVHILSKSFVCIYQDAEFPQCLTLVQID